MSEINVTAVFFPKPEKFEEVATLVTEVIKQVQEHEPDTLLYYAFKIKEKNEIVIVERARLGTIYFTYIHGYIFPTIFNNTLIIATIYRYKNQAAIQTHVKSAYFRSFSGKLPTLLTKPAEIRAGGFLGGSRGVSRL
ncbi:uncharacterized protein N7479_000945 [Penicillium vulpinum]|uniref:uncharacterized protein n=1 Tax=Penicillium vulpinum TaxID=29845 RepID=UPI0025493408|nr:uncharacterized protein N7479_000945 [Penicillium vulpinum]KAJ5971027.1 hypothetical protein N7479_000945 [Penicillium vulpinum]